MEDDEVVMIDDVVGIELLPDELELDVVNGVGELLAELELLLETDGAIISIPEVLTLT